VVEGTFEPWAASPRNTSTGSLKRRVLFTAGLGGMGRSQPFAMTLHGGIDA